MLTAWRSPNLPEAVMPVTRIAWIAGVISTAEVTAQIPARTGRTAARLRPTANAQATATAVNAIVAASSRASMLPTRSAARSRRG